MNKLHKITDEEAEADTPEKHTGVEEETKNTSRRREVDHGAEAILAMYGVAVTRKKSDGTGVHEKTETERESESVKSPIKRIHCAGLKDR